MRLSRQKAVLLVLVAGIACSGTTGPETVSAFFTLQTINGRALPTFLAQTPGPTATIISSTLTLDKTGRGVMVEHRDDMFLGEGTYTTTLDYRIHGNQIEIGGLSPCLANMICPVNRVGTISPFGLSLVINPTSVDAPIVYKYRSLGLD